MGPRNRPVLGSRAPASFESARSLCLTILDPSLASGPMAGAPPLLLREGFIMAKATTIKVKLVSTADTGFYYVTKKNSRTMTDKLVKQKYDPVAKKHVV